MRVTDLLRTMDIFEHLPSDELEKIARLLRERRLAEDQVLCREGDPGDAMFIVTGGKIRLATADGEAEKTLAYFSDGQFFGEMSLLTGEPRSTSAIAETESRVLVLQKDDFDSLLTNNAQIMREMLKVVSERTMQTNQQLLADDGPAAVASGAGLVYVVYSPRGGSGKSTVAVNLATVLARQMPERVALFDLSLTFGHDALLLNAAPRASLAQVPPESLASLDRQALGRYLTVLPSTLQLLVGGTKPEEGEQVTGEHVRAALSVMKRQFMATVIDCAGNFTDPTLAALERADKIIVLATPELNTLRDIREMQRVFAEVVHVDRGVLHYMLNYYQPFKVLTREQFEQALEQPAHGEIPHAGEGAIKAALKGEPLVSLERGSAFTKAIEKLAQDITPEETRQARAKAARQAAAGGSRLGGLFRR
jgi:pilus assembly protein CpaE